MKHTIVAAIITKGQRLLCVKRLHPPYKGMYGLPGGHKLPNETNIEALKREVKEETKLDITIQPTPLGTINYPINDEEEYTVTYYSATIVAGIPTPQPEEISDIKWLTTRELYGHMANFIPLSHVQAFKQIILKKKKP